jgi:Asp-tRNA(Asn)/Glu-tRNA(Gln) amidotransferase A subunit family amidase
VKGTATSWGHAALCNDIAEKDNIFVTGLRKQGAIIICTGSMMYGALGYDVVNNIVGTVTNPHNPNRSPGCSALVASNCVPLEIESDIAASIRTAASFCGLYGHKATEARLPDSRNDRRAFPGLQGVFGPIAQSADDLVLVMKSILEREVYSISNTQAPVLWDEELYQSSKLLRIGYIVNDPSMMDLPACS